MPTAALIVVTGDAGPVALVRALDRMARTVPTGVGIAAVSARIPRMPAALARRVRRVPARSAGGVDAAVAELLASPGTVVVVSGGCRIAAGWWDAVLEISQELHGALGILAGSAGSMTVKPAGVLVAGATPVPLASVRGVDAGAARDGAAVGSAPADAPVRISATMIVKDEEEVLAECLTALSGWVDEILVYDTGSTDRTVEIAEQHGARVVLGYWDDDFGAARNRSLEHCTHDWVFCVDADEVVEGDPAGVRATLARTRDNVFDAMVVSTSWRGATTGEHIRSHRIFRRSQIMWSGAVHEQLVPRAGRLVHASTELLPCTLQHSGYQATTMSQKDKASRNLTLAAAVADRSGPDDPDYEMAWSNYGRGLFGAGLLEESVVAFERVIDRALDVVALVQAGRCAVPALSMLRRVDEVERWLTALEGAEAAGTLAHWRARAALQRGDTAGARAALTGLVPTVDVWGLPHDQGSVTTTSIQVEVVDGRLAEAVAALRHQIRTAPDGVNLNLVVQVARRSGDPLTDFVRLSPEVLRERSIRESVGHVSPDVADEWLSAFHQALPDDPRPVIAGCLVSVRLGLPVMLRWSGAARTLGMADVCPLRAYALDDRMDSASRCLAWAILADTFAEEGAAEQWRASLSTVGEEELLELGAHLEELAPGLLAAEMA